MKYYSTIKRNKLLTHTTAWIRLQRIMWSEKKPVPKVYIALTKHSWNDKGKHNSASCRLRRGWWRRNAHVATEEQNEGSLCRKCSVSWERECQHSGVEIVLRLCGVLNYFVLFIVLGFKACGILVPWLGIKPIPLALTAWSPNHCITREVWLWKLFTLEETR